MNLLFFITAPNTKLFIVETWRSLESAYSRHEVLHYQAIKTSSHRSPKSGSIVSYRGAEYWIKNQTVHGIEIQWYYTVPQFIVAPQTNLNRCIMCIYGILVNSALNWWIRHFYGIKHILHFPKIVNSTVTTSAEFTKCRVDLYPIYGIGINTEIDEIRYQIWKFLLPRLGKYQIL
jgi:hypothetical protein